MQMITVEEAIEFVESNSQTGINAVKMSLKNASGICYGRGCHVSD